MKMAPHTTAVNPTAKKNGAREEEAFYGPRFRKRSPSQARGVCV